MWRCCGGCFDAWKRKIKKRAAGIFLLPIRIYVQIAFQQKIESLWYSGGRRVFFGGIKEIDHFGKRLYNLVEQAEYTLLVSHRKARKLEGGKQ